MPKTIIKANSDAAGTSIGLSNLELDSLQADSITDKAGAGAPDFPQGLTSDNDVVVATDALVVDSTNGRVGVGTASPDETLNVEGVLKWEADSSPDQTIHLQPDGSTITSMVFNQSAASDYSRFNLLNLANATSSSRFFIMAYQAQSGLSVHPDGKVGVGTTSPASKLEVREASASAARLTVSNTEGQAVIETDGARAFFGNAIANTALTIQAGNIGINQTSPSQQLHITATGVANSLLQSTGSGGSDEAILSIQSNSGTAILTRNSSGKTNLGGASSFNIRNASGGVYLPVGGTSWVGLSDMRYKTKVADFTNSLEKLQGLSAFTYTLDEDPEGEKSVHLGMSAQEVYEKIPEVVSGTPETKMGISYGRLVPVLVQAVQELKEENDELRARLDTAGL